MVTTPPLAVVFPGQGSQRPGMGKDFCERYPVSRDTFAEASDALGLDLSALCFEEDPRLDLTEFTQPAILTAEIAMLRALTAELGLRPQWFGGHSLGEYTALCAAGVIPLADAVRIVRLRGALMQRAVPVGEGAMSAVIAEGILEQDLAAELAELAVDVANENSKNQVVVSGATAAIARAEERLAARLAGTEHQVVRLNVSAPFHSRLMRGIEPELRDALTQVASRLVPQSAPRVTSNFTGGFHRPDTELVIDALTRQVSGTVRFVANMQALASVAERIVEVGPHRPLRGFFQTLGRDVASVISVKTAEKLVA